MGETPIWGRYFELRPADLTVIRNTVPAVYLPWGALEWHGPHLPFGMDGILAEAIATRAIRRTGGVLMPTTWWPAGTIPHRDSLSAAGALLGDLLDSIFAQLAKAGWRVVVVVSGHHGYAHEITLIAAAERAIVRYGMLALAVPPLALVDEAMLDHSALWETSLALALRSDLVRLDSLGRDPLQAESSAVIGRDPRNTASASLGVSALNLASERLAAAVSDLINSNEPAALRAFYAQRRVRHQAFVERFGADMEQATKAWWEDLTQEKTVGS
ncbi:MAG: creatininase family protein [Oscillochloris sp.]|nr:creatininase family protein [Oscillochloris sp.]